MAKQQSAQRFIYKVHSSRLRKAKWKLTLPLAEARRNDEVISLASSQLLRWLEEISGQSCQAATVVELRREIRRLRQEPSSLKNRKWVRKLYQDLDELQFQGAYLCVIMDKEKDMRRACKGFSINGVDYVRLLGTNGGVKNKTIVFVDKTYAEELKRRIANGRDLEKEMVPAKFEAYQALCCSASTPVSMPSGVLVVSDCETEFSSDVIRLDDDGDDGEEPEMMHCSNVLVDLNESDGYGLMLPSLARRWGEELGLDYLPSGLNTRYAWEKGMVFSFDFLEFAESVAKEYMVQDVWGDWVDVREVELILTTSMVKLWDSYGSCQEYLQHSKENGYDFAVTKACPKELESQRNLNYQFIQSYDLSEEDIDKLIAPTVEEIEEILHGDYRKTILYLKGTSLHQQDLSQLEDDFVKALMIQPEMIDDPYVQSRIHQMIHNRIQQAKVGVIGVHGNYSIASGDPYALCQHIFSQEVTGLLQSGEIYNQYWLQQGIKPLACFRAPMTCHNNIRKVTVARGELVEHWYQHMNTCTVFNAWDTAAHALNGMDKDGDLVMLTDNEVLVENLRELPALMCAQRKAEKRVITEESLIQANLDSFGDDIGKITNKITSMFEVQSKFPKDSEEYRVLDYRIRCGQLFQQNAIDKAKGIIAKPMPKEWFDRYRAGKMEGSEKRELFLSIVAEKKPYFMRYIYPTLMKEYNTYVKNTEKKALREFTIGISELLEKNPQELTEEEGEFLKYYHCFLPVGMGDCVMNRICWKIEQRFDGYLGRKNRASTFDYSIMKSGAEYSKAQSRSISQLLEQYSKRVQEYTIRAKKERVASEEASSHIYYLQEEFRALCDGVCPNGRVLCEILLDLCYQKSSSKGFVWAICGKEIVENLLERNSRKIWCPEPDAVGEVEFQGRKFRFVYERKENLDEYCVE